MNNELIDLGTYWEIKDYKPILTYDENGNVISVIFCPYIPKDFTSEPKEDDERKG